MFDFRIKDPIGEKLSELKETLVQYGKQEVRDPLVSLFKWTMYGVAGLVFIIAGLGYLSLGGLRLLQSEVGTFDNRLTFLPYLIICAVLVLIAAISYRSVRSR